MAVVAQTAAVDPTDPVDEYLVHLDTDVIVEKADGTSATGKLVAISATSVTVRLKDLRLLDIPRSEVGTVSAVPMPTSRAPAPSPTLVAPTRTVVDDDDADEPRRKPSTRRVADERRQTSKNQVHANTLERQGIELGDEAFRYLLGGGAGVALGGLGFAVALFMPLNCVGLGCLGASCLAITAGAVVAGVGAVKNADAADKKLTAARLREDEMAY